MKNQTSYKHSILSSVILAAKGLQRYKLCTNRTSYKQIHTSELQVIQVKHRFQGQPKKNEVGDMHQQSK